VRNSTHLKGNGSAKVSIHDSANILLTAWWLAIGILGWVVAVPAILMKAKCQHTKITQGV
jgi:hypothetical protein